MQAFGSVSSLEAAYFRETGKQLLLSEQNLMDCAWNYGNTACLGGCALLLTVLLLERSLHRGGHARTESFTCSNAHAYMQVHALILLYCLGSDLNQIQNLFTSKTHALVVHLLLQQPLWQCTHTGTLAKCVVSHAPLCAMLCTRSAN